MKKINVIISILFTLFLKSVFPQAGVTFPVTGITTFANATNTTLATSGPCVPSKTAAVAGWSMSVSSSSNCAIIWVMSGGGTDGHINMNATPAGFQWLGASYGSRDGSEFKLENINIATTSVPMTGFTYVFNGYKDGLPVAGATHTSAILATTGVANGITVTFTNNPAFNNVDEFRIVPSNPSAQGNFFTLDITVGAAISCITPTLTLTSTSNVLCNGAATGSAAVTASGGSSFTYTWLPSGGNASSATGLSAGNYTCTVTNSCGATSIATVAITQPPALNLTVLSQTNVACNGGNNGVAAVNAASGGAGGYSYNWTPGNPPGDGTTNVTGLIAGTWSCTVTDLNGCTRTQTFNIVQPTAINFSPLSQTNVSCNGGNNGAAAVNAASGGAGGFTYNWTPGNPPGDGTTNVTGLTAGTWTCTVTDANSCTRTQTFNIIQPTVINLTSLSQTNVSCNGGNNGAAAVNPASGGAGGFSYNWTPGNPPGDGTTNVTGLTAGTWSCTVTDANSCTRTQTFNITQPTVINLTPLSQTNVACNGGNNGAAAVNAASGGAGGYSYNWTPGNPPGDGTTNVTGLTAGTWSCTVTDANSCTSTQTFAINQPSALASSTAVTNVLCNGGSTGSATVTASGGAGSYTYLWSSAQTTSVISGVNAGVRTVTVTDANGCTATNTVTIIQPGSGIATTTAVTNVLCNGGSTGSATVTASGGAGSYTYLWSSAQTTSVISGLNAGVRTVTVTDANGCTSTNTVTITQPGSGIATTTAVTNVLCNGGSTGSATITASGGAGAYTYLWSSAQTTSVISGVNAGVRTVTVTDANGCSSTNTVTIIQPSALITSTTVTNVLCNGGSTGSATVTASGGAGSYTYLWSSAQTTSVISGLNAGVRTVTVTDANGCSSTNTVTIIQPSALITSTTVTNVLCNGGSTGSATVTASGGAGSYTYLWSSAQTTSVISGLNAGVRTVTVTDANGCTATNTVTITQPGSGIATTTAVTNVLCNGGSTGSATVTASGGAGSYTYLWSSAQTTSVISGLNAGIRTVTVTDANGCTSINTVIVTQPALLTLTVSPASLVVCSGNSVTFTGNASGGTGVLTYSWSTGATTASLVVSPLTTTGYTLFVTDGNACTTNAVRVVTVNTTPTVSVSGGSVCSGQSFTLSPSGASTYTYSGGSSVVSPTITSTYSITGTSSQGCVSSNTALATVTVNAIPVLTAPSQTICSGATATLLASGASTYSWSTGATTNSIVVTPAVSTVYTVNGTSASGCTAVPLTVTVTLGAGPSISVNSTTLCSGNSTTLTASGVNTYTWSTGANTSSIVITPSSTTVYTVTGNLSGCAVTATNTATVTINTTPTVSVSGGSVCSGQSFTLSPSGASTYTYSGGSSVVSPTITSTYSITGTSSQGCVSSNTALATVTVNAIPVLTAPSQTICSGATATLLASGASTYSWSTGATTNSIVVTPAVSTVYTVNGTSASGCTAVPLTVTVTLGAGPSISVNSATLCSGNSTTLTASGVNTYTWSTGANTSSIVITPSSTTVYTVTGNLSGCAVTATNTATVTINTTPTVSVSGGSVCSGQSFTLSPSGASTYTYSGGSSVVSPTITSTYSITGTSAQGCVSSAALVTVTVNTIPVLTASSQTICSGGTATLTAGGASTYSWSTGATTTSITVTPTINTTYTLTGLSAAGCSATPVTASVVLGPAPSLTVNSGILCAGESITLTALGVSSYSWSNGANTSSTVVSPSITTTYSISGQQAGCPVIATANATVVVNALPLLVISGNSVICAGQATSLTISGASSYSWSTGAASAQISVSPSVTTSYSVTGTNTLTGCKNIASQTVIVNSLPVVSIGGTFTVCNGSTTTLNANGASSYTWNTGTSVTALPVSPSVTTVYSVSGTDSNGCSGSASATVSVLSPPVITINSGSVCSGQSFTLSPSGAVNYTYSPGGTAVVTPSATTVYTVTGSNSAGCISTSTVNINVSATPTVSAGNDLILNSGDTFTLSGTSNATTYTWIPAQGLSSANTLTPNGTAQATTVFTLLVNSVAGCANSSTVMLVVNDLPVNNRLSGELQIANYISPNGDGQNDTWKVNNPLLIRDYDVSITDQWGNTVYAKNGNYNNDWDGTWNGQALPDGVYYYFISEGGKTKYSGSITMLR